MFSLIVFSNSNCSLEYDAATLPRNTFILKLSELREQIEKTQNSFVFTDELMMELIYIIKEVQVEKKWKSQRPLYSRVFDRFLIN